MSRHSGTDRSQTPRKSRKCRAAWKFSASRASTGTGFRPRAGRQACGGPDGMAVRCPGGAGLASHSGRGRTGPSGRSVPGGGFPGAESTGSGRTRLHGAPGPGLPSLSSGALCSLRCREFAGSWSASGSPAGIAGVPRAGGPASPAMDCLSRQGRPAQQGTALPCAPARKGS
jgi:hypothetical protein